MITLGLRYAGSTFTDDMVIPRTHYLIGSQDYQFSNGQLTARWVEAVTRLNVRVWQNLYFGASVRLKLFKNLDGQDELVPYDIPGFGRHRKNASTEKTANAGFRYYIMYRLPFRYKPVPPKPIK